MSARPLRGHRRATTAEAVQTQTLLPDGAFINNEIV